MIGTTDNVGTYDNNGEVSDWFWRVASGSLYKQSPFYVQALQIYTAQTTIDTGAIDSTPNPWKNTALALRFLKQAMPYVALWSSILEEPSRYATNKVCPQELQCRGFREAIVEGFFRMLKHDIFHTEKLPVVAQDFTSKLQQTLKGRSLLFLNSVRGCCDDDDEEAPRHDDVEALLRDDNRERAGEDAMRRDGEETLLGKRRLDNAESTTYVDSLLAKDSFKKVTKRKAPLYIGKCVTLNSCNSASFQPLPLNGTVRFRDRNVTMRMSNTCCLDVILMAITAAYKESAAVAVAINNVDTPLKDCIVALSAATCDNEALLARGTLIFADKIFRNVELVHSPLQSTDFNKSKFDISIDTNDLLLCEQLLLCHVNIGDHFVCSRDDCPGTKVVITKFLQISANCIQATIDRCTSGYFALCRTMLSLIPEDHDDGARQRLDDSPPGTEWQHEEQVSGVLHHKLICISDRRCTGIQNENAEAPPFIIFYNSNEVDVDVKCPSIIVLFGTQYSHRATTYLKRATSVYSSGHYTAVVKFGGQWNYYDGIKRKAKPPYFTKLLDKYVAKRRGLTPSIVFYSRDDV